MACAAQDACSQPSRNLSRTGAAGSDASTLEAAAPEAPDAKVARRRLESSHTFVTAGSGWRCTSCFRFFREPRFKPELRNTVRGSLSVSRGAGRSLGQPRRGRRVADPLLPRSRSPLHASRPKWNQRIFSGTEPRTPLQRTLLIATTRSTSISSLTRTTSRTTTISTTRRTSSATSLLMAPAARPMKTSR